MKNILFFIIFIAFIYSCVYEHEEYHSKPKPQADLFKEADEMNGLGPFIIGKTLKSEMKEINKKISKDDKYGYVESKYGFEEKERKESDPLSSFFIYEGCSFVKEYNISEFFIGDIKIDHLDLFFSKDTLYEIHCKTSSYIQEAFTKKYGEGVKVHWSKRTGFKSNISFDVFTQIKWENENIVADFIDWGKGDKKHFEMKDDFTISSKSKRIHDEILKCKNSEYEKKKKEVDAKKNENLDKI
jgi:hypothetical protein